MAQPEGFAIEGKEYMGYRLKKSIYGLKLTSRQCYLKFNEVVKKFSFSENQVGNCIYIKINGIMFIILVRYVDDILLASNDKNLLYKAKRFLSSYVLGIEIHRDRTRGVLGLSQKAYINKVLKLYNMHDCFGTHVRFIKGNKLGTFQCRRNQLEIDQIKLIHYNLSVRSIMYAQICMCPDLAFVSWLLGKIQSNIGMKH
jgi:hypothetical protein